MYDIRKEDPGKELLLNHGEICRYIFHSNISQWWPDDSIEQTIKGWDFSLENGLNIDLKSNVGEYKPGRYYDKVCLSAKRNNKDCLLCKETDLWFFPIQTCEDYIEFITLNRKQVLTLLQNQPLTKPILAGGKWQEMLIIDFNSPFITRYVPVWDIKNEKLTRRVVSDIGNKDNLAEFNLFS